VILAFLVESRIGHRGLSTLANARGPFEETLLLDYPAGDRFLTESYGSVERVQLSTSYDGWPVETVSSADVEVLVARIKNWMEADQ
jgi:hypothetical protein